MNRKLASAIVNCFAMNASEKAIAALGEFSLRDWKRTLYWLDWSGLALRLANILETEMTRVCAIPMPIFERLRQNRLDNTARVSHMLTQLDTIGNELQEQGVAYAVLKGLSLIPHVCPDASLRHQADLDLLLSRSDIEKADVALSRLGYRRAVIKPWIYTYARVLDDIPRHEDLYKPGDYPIELHFSIWEHEDQIAMEEPDDCLSRSRSSSWTRLCHPVLAPEDSFLLQCFHVFHHLFDGYWIKPSWIYELGRAVVKNSETEGFWKSLRNRCRSANSLATIDFAFSLCESVLGVQAQAADRQLFQTRLTPVTTLWVKRYGKEWVTTGYPGSKLVLLLRREFFSRPDNWSLYERRRIFPIVKVQNTTLRSSTNSRLSTRSKRAQLQWHVARAGFHLREIPRYYVQRRKWNHALAQQYAVA